MSRLRDILCPGALPLSLFYWCLVSSQLFVETNASAGVQRCNRLLGGIFGFFRGVIIAAISILLRAALQTTEKIYSVSAVLMDSVNWVEWIGANSSAL